MKASSMRMKISLLCLVVIICAASITLFVLKSDNDNYKTFTQVSKGLSKNFNQFGSTPGITQTGFAADPDKKVFKIGINIDDKKITSEQLKEVLVSYLINASSFNSEKDWKSLLKPYSIRIEELSSGRLIAEKPLDSTEIVWK